MIATALPAAPAGPPLGHGRERVPSLVLAGVVAAFLLLTPLVPVDDATVRVMSDVDGSWVQVDARALPSPLVGGVFSVVGAVAVVAGVLIGRRSPVGGTVLTLLPFLAVPWNGGWAWGWWLGTLAVAALAALDRLRRAVVPVLASALVVAVYCGTETPAYLPIGPVTSGTGSAYETPVLVMYLVGIAGVVGVAAAIGSGQRSRLREEEAEALERQALETESLAGERARLARDLHDVVAHHVSLVAVRAESAPFVHPGLDDEARAVLAAIAVDAREALAELRQVLVVLQRTGAEGERAPQPTACDVDELVASAVAAGQPVTVEGRWHDVAAGPGYVLYRAAQEGLTNARRHAPGTTTTLVRSQGEGTARLRLANPAVAAGPTGRGLIGMRERVEALGGTVSAGVVGGQFVLDVAVPAGAPDAHGDRATVPPGRPGAHEGALAGPAGSSAEHTVAPGTVAPGTAAPGTVAPRAAEAEGAA